MRTLLLVILWLSAGPGMAAEMQVHRDLKYAGTDDPRQTLDLYAPAAAGQDRPVVLFIHGGGWHSGDKSSVDAKPQTFVDQDDVFVSINYRLLPDVTIAQMAGDVAKAIAWIHSHAREYGGDPGKLIVMGHSAGAQLAALVCTDRRYLKAEGLTLSATVKGCVPVDGDTYDVPLQIATVEARRANIYRGKFGDVESQKNLSPVMHIAKGAYIPPFLILHVADHPETKLQSERLAGALQEAGVAVKVLPARNADHVSINAHLGKPGDAPTAALFEFVAECLKR